MNKTAIALTIGIVLVGAVGYYAYAQMQTPKVSETQQEATATPGAGAKINIDAVCRGALAYMTFTDGASADAFVADCKEGKHPEVIERYKASLNVDGAAI